MPRTISSKVPDSKDALRHARRALARGDFEAAQTDFRRVTEIDPDNVDAWIEFGALAARGGDSKEALRCYGAALAREPDRYEALLRSAVLLGGQSDFAAAAERLRRACEIRPDDSVPHRRLGQTLRALGDLDGAVTAIRDSLRLDPDDERTLAQLVYARMCACDWTGLEEEKARLKTAAGRSIGAGKRPAVSPFVAAVTYDDPAFAFEVANAHSRDVARRAERFEGGLAQRSRVSRSARVRLGYLSAGFTNHPTAHLTQGLYRRHDRSKFEVAAFSLMPMKGSAYATRIRDDCDLFIDLSQLSTRQAVDSIGQAEIDILIDLHGYLQNGRIDIAAARPAPVQVAYLGFPGTTGADFFDYVICDGVTVPSEHRRYFSEKPVFMPHCYQVNDREQNPSEAPQRRSDYALPDGVVVFCCFNMNYKIDARMFGAWMEILAAVPDSVLWLLRSNPVSERNLKCEASGHGIDPNRLVFADMVQKEDHLARLPLADLALDTRICNGHTTTTDALGAGLPVVTLLGRHFASRVAASLITNHGLPEMVTVTLANYTALAIALGSDRDRLARLGHQVRANATREPLFDIDRFMRNLDGAYLAMWQRHLDGLPPCPLEIVEG